jgi:RNA polymerase sigma-70 factor (ECF subfamily)
MAPRNTDHPAPVQDQQQTHLEQLLGRAVAGDEAARNQLLEALLPRLRDQVQRRLKVPYRGTASDVLNSVVRPVINQSAPLPSTLPHFLAWVGVIVRNRCNEEGRRWVKRPCALPDEVPDTEEDKDRRAVLVWGALQLLPDRDRRVLEQTFYDRMSSAEIGAGMGLGAGAVNVLRFRALKKLRVLLENRHGNE